MNAEVEQIASSDPACQRLRKIPGIGPLVATAIVTAIGNGATFHKDREFASWMGLCRDSARPGGKARLFGISKRGNNYLRKILVHGARSAVLRVKRERAPFGAWLDALELRAPINVVIAAAANDLTFKQNRLEPTKFPGGQLFLLRRSPDGPSPTHRTRNRVQRDHPPSSCMAPLH
jgi:transposase